MLPAALLYAAAFQSDCYLLKHDASERHVGGAAAALDGRALCTRETVQGYGHGLPLEVREAQQRHSGGLPGRC